jgi:hypothetical protein
VAADRGLAAVAVWAPAAPVEPAARADHRAQVVVQVDRVAAAPVDRAAEAPVDLVVLVDRAVEAPEDLVERTTVDLSVTPAPAARAVAARARVAEVAPADRVAARVDRAALEAPAEAAATAK